MYKENDFRARISRKFHSPLVGCIGGSGEERVFGSCQGKIMKSDPFYCSMLLTLDERVPQISLASNDDDFYDPSIRTKERTVASFKQARFLILNLCWYNSRKHKVVKAASKEKSINLWWKPLHTLQLKLICSLSFLSGSGGRRQDAAASIWVEDRLETLTFVKCFTCKFKVLIAWRSNSDAFILALAFLYPDLCITCGVN